MFLAFSPAQPIPTCARSPSTVTSGIKLSHCFDWMIVLLVLYTENVVASFASRST
ncbi:hypothetical protein RSAG8_08347, partial [Rhizoctonia solani AG-8 WAC10335]